MKKIISGATLMAVAGTLLFGGVLFAVNTGTSVVSQGDGLSNYVVAEECTWGCIKCKFNPEACGKKKEKHQVSQLAKEQVISWGALKCRYDPKCSGKKEG